MARHGSNDVFDRRFIPIARDEPIAGSGRQDCHAEIQHLQIPPGVGGRYSLAWTAATGAETYRVKRATISGGSYTVIASAVTGTNYVDSGVTPGVTYYYVVSAVNTAGESPNSNQAGARPK